MLPARLRGTDSAVCNGQPRLRPVATQRDRRAAAAPHGVRSRAATQRETGRRLPRRLRPPPVRPESAASLRFWCENLAWLHRLEAHRSEVEKEDGEYSCETYHSSRAASRIGIGYCRVP